MRRNQNRKSILARAAMCALYATPFYAEGEGDKGGGGAGDKKPDDKGAKKIELTDVELEQRTKSAVEAALKKERDDAAKAKAKDDEDRDRKKAEEQGEYKTLAEKADKKREEAERERDEARHDALIANVKVDLRDHLATDHPEYLANAADIMLHVEKKLVADAKPEDIKKLITDEAKAFVERTPRTKSLPGTLSGPVRGKAPANTQRQQQQPANGNVPARPSIAGRSF